MRHVTHMIFELCHAHACVVSHICLLGHVTNMHAHSNESCHTYERVMSHMCMSNVTHVNESCHTYERVMSRIYRATARAAAVGRTAETPQHK